MHIFNMSVTYIQCVKCKRSLLHKILAYMDIINPSRGQQHSFVEVDHEIFSTVILSLADSRRAGVSFWRKNVHNTGYLLSLKGAVVVKWLLKALYFCKHVLFSASNSHMHIFTMSVIYVQSFKKTQWKLLEKLITQSLHYQSYYNHLISKELQIGRTLVILGSPGVTHYVTLHSPQ